MDDILGVTCDTRRYAVEQQNEIDKLHRELRNTNSEFECFKRKAEESAREEANRTTTEQETQPVDTKYLVYEKEKALKDLKIALSSLEKMKEELVRLEEANSTLLRDKETVRNHAAKLEDKLLIQQELSTRCKKLYDEYQSLQKDHKKSHIAAVAAHQSLQGKQLEFYALSRSLHETLKTSLSENEILQDCVKSHQTAYLTEANKTADLTATLAKRSLELEAEREKTAGYSMRSSEMVKEISALTKALESAHTDIAAAASSLDEAPVYIDMKIDPPVVKVAEQGQQEYRADLPIYMFTESSEERRRIATLEALLEQEKAVSAGLERHLEKVERTLLESATDLIPKQHEMPQTVQLCTRLAAENASLKAQLEDRANHLVLAPRTIDTASPTPSQQGSSTPPPVVMKRRRITGILHKQK
eukprot:TRINITY_DN30894_c0_g1_i1.p1 TRINITY_DN30894_c0_g1~~TRINITY_DN30894_c0_g1_i1.p1  ORF type:complete len:417 (+),score=105.97 TRINITY_DN30894_c0_g1_i1:35-1285(+)